MVDRLKSIGVVTILTLIVWLFAESESLVESELPARVDVVVGEVNREKLLVKPMEFDGRISIEMRGPRAAINRASQLLQTPIRLQPGALRGIPTTEGNHVVRMLDFIKAWPELGSTGVSIDYVRPAEIRVEVQELRIVALEPRAQTTGIAIDGEVRFTPAQISVRMPSTLATTADRPDFVLIPLAPADPTIRLTPGLQSLSLPVTLPDALKGKPGVTLMTPQVVANFTVLDTNVTERFTSVPVQVLAPPIELKDWIVEIAPSDAILQVDVRGPRTAIESLKSGKANLVAVVSLLDIDLTPGASSKPVRFAVLRDGVMAPVPQGVEVLSEKSEAKIQITRRSGP